MDDRLQNRFNEAFEYLEVFEERLARLSRDPNNTELHHDIGELSVLTTTSCNVTGRPNLVDYSGVIQAALDEFRDSSTATERAAA